MTNEAVLKLKLEEPWDWIIEDSVAVEKGALMKISGVAAGFAMPNAGTGDVFAGIARREKIANDGRTRLALFRRGIFDMVAAPGATITGGDWVATSGVNLIRRAISAELLSGVAIGIAREDIAANGTGEVILGGF